jgi:hypothetical protein
VAGHPARNKTSHRNSASARSHEVGIPVCRPLQVARAKRATGYISKCQRVMDHDSSHLTGGNRGQVSAWLADAARAGSSIRPGGVSRWRVSHPPVVPVAARRGRGRAGCSRPCSRTAGWAGLRTPPRCPGSDGRERVGSLLLWRQRCAAREPGPDGLAALLCTCPDVAGARLLLRAAAWACGPEQHRAASSEWRVLLVRARRCRAPIRAGMGAPTPTRASLALSAAQGYGRGAGKAPCCATSRVHAVRARATRASRAHAGLACPGSLRYAHAARAACARDTPVPAARGYAPQWC